MPKGERNAELNRARGKHFQARNGQQTPEYMTWAHMIKRCENQTYHGFANYGGRGIKVCERWRASFLAFFEDMGLRPSAKHSLDRKDVNGDYTPDNCRWASAKEQGRNRRNNRILTIAGESVTLAEAAERFGVNRGTIKGRLARGWTPEMAVDGRDGRRAR